jgi:hypothetical protein
MLGLTQSLCPGEKSFTNNPDDEPEILSLMQEEEFLPELVPQAFHD